MLILMCFKWHVQCVHMPSFFYCHLFAVVYKCYCGGNIIIVLRCWQLDCLVMHFITLCLVNSFYMCSWGLFDCINEKIVFPFFLFS